MVVSLVVDRSKLEYKATSASLVYLDPEVQEANTLPEGSLVRLATYWGRNLWARVGPSQQDDRGSGIIRLDRFQRQNLKAHLHEKLEIYPEPEKAVSRVYLQPSVDLFTAKSHHIEEHLREELTENRTPVVDGQMLFAHFHHSSAGIMYRVRKVEGGPGVVGAETQITLEPAPDGFTEDFSLDTTLEDVGGLDQEIRLVKELVQIPLQFPSVYRQLGIRPLRGVIFYGPPGTGKTHLARAIVSELHAQFFYINGPEIVGTMYGETEGNLRKIFSEATHHAPSVIFIDELDVMAPKRGETGSHSDTRMVTQLLSLMDGMSRVEGVIVIGTTNRVDAIDRALRRPGRFDRELYLGPPTEKGREQILRIHTREMPLAEDAGEFLPELARTTHGFVGADLMELCREGGLNALRRQVDILGGDLDPQRTQQLHLEDVRVSREDLLKARSFIRPSATRETLVVFPDLGFADIGGHQDAKDQLTEYVVTPLQEGTVSERLNPDGILLYGPSGTGKSMLARATAKESGVNLISVSGPELFTKWLGESEEAVRHVFVVARQLAPCIVFFDQLDAVAPVRGLESGSRTTERVVSQLLSELDALQDTPEVVAMAATNRIDLVDPSLLRPGRFGIRIHVPLPNLEERHEIVDLQLASLGLAETLSPQLREALATDSQGLSGADLRGVCQELRRRAAMSSQTPGEQDVEAALRHALEATSAVRSRSSNGRDAVPAGAGDGGNGILV